MALERQMPILDVHFEHAEKTAVDHLIDFSPTRRINVTRGRQCVKNSNPDQCAPIYVINRLKIAQVVFNVHIVFTIYLHI